MRYYSDLAYDDFGNTKSGVLVTVKLNGSIATIYSDSSGTVASNPLTTGDTDPNKGRFSFWYSSSGTYTFEVLGVEVGKVTLDDVSSIVSSYNVFESLTAAEIADAQTGSPTIDTTAKIQTAINTAFTAGQRCYASGTFKTTGKVVFKGDADFSQATFNCTGIGTGIAVEVSTGSATNPTDVLFRKRVLLPSIVNMDKPGTGWVGQGTGLRTVNTDACYIYCPRISGFAIGHLDTSYSQGNVYNEVHVLHYDNNKVNHKLAPGDSVGWVNENLYVTGRRSHNSGEGTNVAGTRHILISIGTAGWSPPNNNTFIKPSIEGDVCEYHVELDGCTDNELYRARWEATTPKLLLNSTNGAVTRNAITRGYGSQNIVVTTSGSSVSENRIESAYGVLQEVVGASGKTGLNFSHRTSDTTYGVMTSWPTTIDPATLTGSETTWTIRWSNTQLRTKYSAAAFDCITIDTGSYRILFGPGTHAQTTYLQSDANDNLTLVNGSGTGYVQAAVNVTAANLQDKTHAINTANKFAGKWVHVSDTGRMVYTSLSGNTAVWKFADGTTAYTPV